MAKIFGNFTKSEGYAIFMAVGIQTPVKDVPVDQADLLRPKYCRCLISCPTGELCGSENGCMSTPDGCGPWGTLGCHYQCVPA